MMPIIDLFSDTQTQPTEGMRAAMARATVGDEQSDTDPTTRKLCQCVAGMLGMEDGVFMPSGTMCNLVSILVHTRPGDEVIVDDRAHIFNTEAAGAAAIAGVSVNPIRTERGLYTGDEVEAAIRPTSRTSPRSGMISIEQTTNFSGGSIWPLEQMRAIRDLCRPRGLRCHIDGARLLNAVVATGVSAANYCEGWDSAWIDLSKGLGCPVGAVLCGSKGFIAQAWQWKYRLGGAMRQSGVLAAAGLYALDNHIEQLRADNDHAALFEGLLRRSTCLSFASHIAESNIVLFSVEPLGISADAFTRECLERGVRLRSIGGCQIRATTSLLVTRQQVEQAARAIQDISNLYGSRASTAQSTMTRPDIL
jgi:threonine aldolase